MSFFHKKKCQNFWATIMSFEPVTLTFYWPKKVFRALNMIAEITTGENCPNTIDRHHGWGKGGIVMQLILGCNSKITVMFL